MQREGYNLTGNLWIACRCVCTLVSFCVWTLVCFCVGAFMGLCVYACEPVYVYVRTCPNVRVCVCTCVYVRVRFCLCLGVILFTCARKLVCVQKWVCVCMRVYVYRCTCVRLCVCACVRVWMCLLVESQWWKSKQCTEFNEVATLESEPEYLYSRMSMSSDVIFNNNTFVTTFYFVGFHKIYVYLHCSS